jgi:hypothetical protein
VAGKVELESIVYVVYRRMPEAGWMDIIDAAVTDGLMSVGKIDAG